MNDKHSGRHSPFLKATTRRATAASVRVAARLRRVVLGRAVERAARSIECRTPTDERILRDIGLNPFDADRLVKELHVLAADQFHVSLKPTGSSSKAKQRSR